MASSLNSDFEEVLKQIKQGREAIHTGFEPVYYLIFQPQYILEAKRLLPVWKARLSQEHFEASSFSFAHEIERILKNDKRRKIWLKADERAPMSWKKTNEALENSLVSAQILLIALKERLEEVKKNPKGLLLLTDLEALHPYLRIGTLESQLQGEFSVPTLILYPGVRTGKTRLKFLGFYPEDGNYRSQHIGSDEVVV